ncbi:hypothetical protein CGCTS75_v008001 [Colletotrichum tropicale]|nr:hypothetical protein CGCTS75_v008001 [Colletotrichum tropicale]
MAFDLLKPASVDKNLCTEVISMLLEDLPVLIKILLGNEPWYQKVVATLQLRIPETSTVDRILARWNQEVVRLEKHVKRMKLEIFSQFSVDLKDLSDKFEVAELGIRTLLAKSLAMQDDILQSIKDQNALLVEVNYTNDIAAGMVSVAKDHVEDLRREKKELERKEMQLERQLQSIQDERASFSKERADFSKERADFSKDREYYRAIEKAMMRSLLAQLLRSPKLPPPDLGFLSEEMLEACRRGESYALCKIFVEIVKQTPSQKTMFCIIDGISWYEHDPWQQDVYRVASVLEHLAKREDLGESGPLKVMLTSPDQSMQIGDLAMKHSDVWGYASLEAGDIHPDLGWMDSDMLS